MKTQLFYHFVFVTKYRRKVLNETRMNFVVDNIKQLCHKFGYDLVEINGDLQDHIHFILGLKPTHSVSSVVQILKSFSTVNTWREFPELRKYYWYYNHLWSSGYYCDTVGNNSYERVVKYIRNQGVSSSPLKQ